MFWDSLKLFFLMLKYVCPMNRFNSLKHMQHFNAGNSKKVEKRKKIFSFQLYEKGAKL